MTALILSLIFFISGLCTKVFHTFDFLQVAASDLSGTISFIVDWLNKVNFLVPLSDIVAIMGIVMAYRIFDIGCFFINWIVRRVFDVIP